MENIATTTSLPSAKETAVAFRDKGEREKRRQRKREEEEDRESFTRFKHPS